MIALAGTLWGTIGMFGKLLFQYNLSSQLVVFCRLFFGFLILLLYLLIKDRSLLRITKKGLKYTALIGFFSQALFNLFYFQSIKLTTISTAVVLLYTAPIFLIIMGRIFYKEYLSLFKVISLILCIIGCFLTATGGVLSSLSMNFAGILLGISAGFTYALVTIFSKAILDDVHPLTIILYGFGFGWIFLMPFSRPVSLLHIHYNLPLILSLIGLGLIPSVLSYIFYFTGLSYNIEASKAGIICSLEIVVSVLISHFMFKETIWGFKLVGIIVVLTSIILIQLDKPQSRDTNTDADLNRT